MDPGTRVDSSFQTDAGKYAAYLQTPEGRLRLDLAFANVQQFLPARQAGNALCALDLGCGTGVAAVRLARESFQVTLLDRSQAMLDFAQHAALDTGVAGQTTLKYGDVTRLSGLFDAQKFDLVLCHNVLEYVDDPQVMLNGAAGLLRDSSSLVSVMVRNQAGEVLKAAIQAGDLAGADEALEAEWGQESLYGGKVRLFRLEQLRELMKAASLNIVGERGVRTVTDYLPSKISRSDEYDRIFELEQKLGSRPEFVCVSRYLQVLARRSA